jgi:hypothetical protein
LLIAADEPEIHAAAQKLRDEKGGGAIEALHRPRYHGRRRSTLRSGQGQTGECIVGQRRTRARPCVPRPGMAAGWTEAFTSFGLPEVPTVDEQGVSSAGFEVGRLIKRIGVGDTLRR